ncbi:MAG: hypothetical protein J1E37_08680 [Prevotella sp.]|nr:hypothetical protein [Prevotella sp.]
MGNWFNYYKRNEKTILSLLLVVLAIVNISIILPSGKTNRSMEDVDTVEVDSTTLQETTVEQHEVTYKIQNHYLVAYIDGKPYNTGLKDELSCYNDEDIDAIEKLGGGEHRSFKIGKVIDLDNNGYAEAILEVYVAFSNVADYDTYEIIYYDPQSDSFKRIEDDGISLELEKVQDYWTFIVREGSLRYKQYMYRDGKVALFDIVEKELPGTILATYSIKSMFPYANDSGETFNTFIKHDLNKDGYLDVIDVEYWDSEARGNHHGDKYTISGIYMGHEVRKDAESETEEDIVVTTDSSGREIEVDNYTYYKLDLILTSDFSILSSRTKGMCDLMTSYERGGYKERSYKCYDIYQWDGKKYNLVCWDGKKFKVTKN